MTCAALRERPRHDDSHASYESRERILEVTSRTMKTGPAGRGGVLRDHRGIVRGIFSYSVGNKDSNKTELLAVVKAIDLSSSKNDFVGLNFLVESDSASVVSWMNNPCSVPWKFHELFVKVSRFSSGLGNISFCHTFREANSICKTRGE
ncbi:hypothetical protein NC651_031033 [Populus alba x Populus x berolinensis]|nr:hypothetical protein NC651_031033 [Populus alba x Populus x berolinensis]